MTRLLTIFILALFITSCASTPKKLNVENFTHTGSWCWDALVLNQVAAGCVSGEIVREDNVSEISCKVYKDDANPADEWLINKFITVLTGPGKSIPTVRNVMPVCADNVMVVFVEVEGTPIEIQEH